MSRKKRQLPWVLLGVWLVVSLACNLPTTARLRQRQEAYISSAVAQTAAAWANQVGIPTSTQAVEQTPIPETAVPTPMVENVPAGGQVYVSQPGDTLYALTQRFNVNSDGIQADFELPVEGFLPPGTPLTVLNPAVEDRYPNAVLPDSAVVYSPATVGFDVFAYVQEAGGYLSSYSQEVDGRTLSGAEVVDEIARLSSTNPRLLLAIIEHRSGWVRGQPFDANRRDFPLGFGLSDFRGLYRELSLAVRQISIGYYGWRAGTLTELTFMNSGNVRISPGLNAGSVAVQYLFTKFYYEGPWEQSLYGAGGFLEVYAEMFGNPWERALEIAPLFPADTRQPELVLPFASGERWSMTGGPHAAWWIGSPPGALDFAPVTGEAKCAVSRAWTLAAASGVIARSGLNVVALDLDGDGQEGTGWVLVYMHVANQDRVAQGSWVNVNDPIGHPSCEGGKVTGTHVHVTRKFNGEWIAADGPLPFVLSGWESVSGEKPYQGLLVKGDQIVSAYPDGRSSSIIVRD